MANPLVTVAVASTLSCAAGSFATYILTKKYVSRQYEGLIEEEVEKAKEYYSRLNKTGDYSDPVAAAEKLLDNQDAEYMGDETITEDEQRLADKYADDDSDRIDDHQAHVNYNKLAGTYGGEVRDEPPARGVHRPNPGETMEDFEQRLIDNAKAQTEERIKASEDSGIQNGEEATVKRHNIFTDRKPTGQFQPLDRDARSNARPYIIETSEFVNGDPEYNQITLTYFDGDGILVDDNMQPISNKVQTIGTNEPEFGRGSDDINVVYIRNEELEVDFEVVRSDESFAHQVQMRGRG